MSFLDPLLPAACFRFFDPGACPSFPSGSGIPVTANHAARWRRSSATSSRVSIRTEDTADPVVLDLRAAGGPNTSAPPAESDTSAPPPPNRIRVKNPREGRARPFDPSAGGAPSVGSARSNPTASPEGGAPFPSPRANAPPRAAARIDLSRPVYAFSGGSLAGSNTTSPTVTSRPGLSLVERTSSRTAGSELDTAATVTCSANVLLSFSSARDGRPGNAGGSSSVASTAPPAASPRSPLTPPATTEMSPLSALRTTGATRLRPLSNEKESIPPILASSSFFGAARTSTTATWFGGIVAGLLPYGITPATRSPPPTNACSHAAILPSFVRHPSGGGSGRNTEETRRAASETLGEMSESSGAPLTSTRVTRTARTVLTTDVIVTGVGFGLSTATRRYRSFDTATTPKSITPMMRVLFRSRLLPSLIPHGTVRPSPSFPSALPRKSSAESDEDVREPEAPPAFDEPPDPPGDFASSSFLDSLSPWMTAAAALAAASAMAAARNAACSASKHVSWPWNTFTGISSVVRFVSSASVAVKMALVDCGSYSTSNGSIAPPAGTVVLNGAFVSLKQHASSGEES